MPTTTPVAAVICILVPGWIGGCAASNQNLGDTPQVHRPVELDKLNMFLGKWEGQFQVRIPGQDQPITGTGTSHYEWTCDRWVLMEHSQTQVDGEDATKDVCLWSWDPKGRKYQLAWLDNTGTMMHATGQFESDGKTMRVIAHGANPLTGKRTYGQGSIAFTDPNTKVWSFKQWNNPFKWGQPIISSGTHLKQ